jgi:proline iminopeptidase
MEQHYLHHILRLPLEQWPDPVQRAFAHLNRAIYAPMQGPSELGASGVLVDWDRMADLSRINVPTLVISADYDTMDPVHLAAMADAFPRGEHLHGPQGSHLAMYDDQETYFRGLISFLTKV